MLFIKHSDSGEVTTLFVYVDNIIMTRNNELEVNFKTMLDQRI